MKLHILGICGTFMGSLALLARELGHQVSGADENVYPPMSTQLAEAGIELCQGWKSDDVPENCDCVIIGNALSRGNPVVEYVLTQGLPYASGPQWLGEHLLRERSVIAIAGTHGKTTTACMVAHMLECAGHNPGFLIGGVPGNFPQSARLGTDPWFVIEADEYDTAFFDKRSKFVHYHPHIALLNNLEFDHADIFDDLGAIITQFHHLLRVVPANGTVVMPAGIEALDAVIARGIWSQYVTFGPNTPWHAEFTQPQHQTLGLTTPEGFIDTDWQLSGEHNLHNALAAICVAAQAGVAPQQAAGSLQTFTLPRRRQQELANDRGVVIYDDFAHHPTAISATLEALAARAPDRRLLLALEPRSNTMKRGVHNEQLASAMALADHVWLHAPADLGWDPCSLDQSLDGRLTVVRELDGLPQTLVDNLRDGDQMVFMSNGGFGGVAQKTADLWLTQSTSNS